MMPDDGDTAEEEVHTYLVQVEQKLITRYLFQLPRTMTEKEVLQVPVGMLQQWMHSTGTFDHMLLESRVIPGTFREGDVRNPTPKPRSR